MSRHCASATGTKALCASAGAVAKRAFKGRQINLVDVAVGGFNVRHAGQGQLLGQAILKRAKGALGASTRLG